MSFDYGSNDRDRDRDHSDRRGGYNNDRESGYSGAGRTAVHDSYERDREYAREAGYDERGGSGEETRRGGYGGSYGNDEGSAEYNNQSRGGYSNDERSTDAYGSSTNNRRNEREERGDYGSGSGNSNYNEDRSGRGHEEGNYGGETNNRERETYSGSSRGNEDFSSNPRDSQTGDVGLPGGGGGGGSGGKGGSGAIDWQSVGTQVAIAGIQHFAKSYDKASDITNEEQLKYDEADGAGGSQAKESAFAKKLGERQGDGAKLGDEAGDLKDKLMEGGLGFLKGAFGGRK